MALDRYGVLSGTLLSHFRDTPDDQGRWFHINLRVRAAGADYRAAVDVDSKQSAVGVEWKTIHGLAAADLGSVASVAEGYHDLAHTSTSGALDYVRSPWMKPSAGCVFVAMPTPWLDFLSRLFGRAVPGWTQGSNLDAADAFEPLLVAGARLLVYGQPFTTGLGMHNVHQNQGDPAGSQWWAENGIWQDGATLVARPNGTWSAFVSKFTTQAYRTDGQGHPA